VAREVNAKVETRITVARKRLASVLTRHCVAHQRTLEQKISDADPTNQRIEPVLLKQAMSRMRETGDLSSLKDQASVTKWYHLPETPTGFVVERLTVGDADLVADAVTNELGQLFRTVS
jgi:hypothetical protein